MRSPGQPQGEYSSCFAVKSFRQCYLRELWVTSECSISSCNRSVDYFCLRPPESTDRLSGLERGISPVELDCIREFCECPEGNAAVSEAQFELNVPIACCAISSASEYLLGIERPRKGKPKPQRRRELLEEVFQVKQSLDNCGKRIRRGLHRQNKIAICRG